MQELGLSDVCSNIDAAFRSEDHKRVEHLLWPALNQFPDLPQLWFYAGNLLFQTDKSALAVQAFERCIELDENPLVLANLGAAYRRLNMHDEGIRVLQAALDRDPNYAPALVNLGSMYVNEGMAEKGIPYLERAVALGKKGGKMETGAMWNLGLLYLEAGRFGEGFDIYRLGTGSERRTRFYGSEAHGIVDPPMLQPGDPTHGKTLIVWGEQGIGDELMFGTCLEDARKDFGEIIFECHPRLQELHRTAHLGLRLFPHRKDEVIDWPIKHGIKADYKAPLGDLAAMYRRTASDFTRAYKAQGPVYRANRAETVSYRQQLLEMAAGRPIVGLATRGGVMQTARTYRTLRIPDADYLFENTDCLFVALDYDDMMGFTTYVHDKHGAGRYQWFPAIVQHWDYHHVAALIAACDLTVTVCQSIAHMSASMGHPTRVLTPKRCAWRYAPTDGDSWYWYPDPKVKLYRQDDPQSWRGPLDRVIADIKAL